MKWNKEDLEKLNENYGLKTKSELLNLFPNRSYDAIKLMAAKLGLKKEINELISGNLNKLLEETPEAYYWIGFIMADGTINHKNNRLKVSLSVRDESHLIKLMTFLEIDASKKKNYNVGKMVEFSIMDNFILPKIIEKFDFKQSKTYNPPNLSYLTKNDDLFLSFLIGFIDGDGTIKKKKNVEEYSLAIKLHSSWYDNLSFFQKQISKITDSKRVCLYKYKYAIYIINDFKILKLLKTKINKLCLPILQRKWDKINLERTTRIEQGLLNKIKIKKMFKDGHSVLNISKEIGLTYSRVYAICKYEK
jgi:hypothetical protein